MRAQVNRENNINLSAAGLRAFFNICKGWECKTEEMMTLLGINSRSTFFKYKKDPENVRLQHDTLERISYILNIHSALRILFSHPDSIYKWIRKANSNRLYKGKSAMDIMLGGRVMDIHWVMKYLDSRRGGWS
jgi:hypothetical protein